MNQEQVTALAFWLGEQSRALNLVIDYRDLTRPEQAVKLIWELEAEVNNGGFSQYYFNSAGDHANEAVFALLAIGAKACAEIVGRANQAWSLGPVPTDREVRMEAIAEQFGEKEEEYWHRLDEQFYEYPDDLQTLMVQYAIARQKEIAGFPEAITRIAGV